MEGAGGVDSVDPGTENCRKSVQRGELAIPGTVCAGHGNGRPRQAMGTQVH